MIPVSKFTESTPWSENTWHIWYGFAMWLIFVYYLFFKYKNYLYFLTEMHSMLFENT